MTDLLLHSLAYPVRSLGPGTRAVIWTAGCSRRPPCPGCISPEMRDPKQGRPIAVQTLARRLLELPLPLTGLTVSGGEPMDQPVAVAGFLSIIAKARPDWDVVLYTGYKRNELTSPEALGVLDRIDVLIAGPYRREVPSPSPLAGSGNQKFHYLTARARCRKMEYEKNAGPVHELAFGPPGFNLLVGVGDDRSRRDAMNRTGAIPAESL